MNKHTTVYLDHAAATTIAPEIVDAMVHYYSGIYSNASSLYNSARNTKFIIQKSRESIASVLNSLPEEIIFTGSGTESDNLAILGVARAYKKCGTHILISAIEHKAVIESAKQLEREGFVVEYIPVNEHGMINVADCISRIKEETILISVMYANNEIGTIQPIQKLTKALKQHKQDHLFPIFHTDACQAAGYLSLDVAKLGVDLLTLNASKIYGPKGIGLLYKNKKITVEPLVFGGGQEKGLRAGTENLPLIIGFKEALIRVEKRRTKESERLGHLRDECLKALKLAIPTLVVNGHLTFRLPNNIHISIPEVEGESMVLMLDEQGIEASTGSACSSHDLQVSHVLTAIKQNPFLMHGSLRFTFGETTTMKECERLVEVLPTVVSRLRVMSPVALFV